MRLKKKLFIVIFASLASIGGYAVLMGLSGCDEGECLAHGENCAQDYIDANYGGIRPPCCNAGDYCQQSSYSGYLTCN